MTENNQTEQAFHSPEEAEIDKEHQVNEGKKNHLYKRHTHIPLDPREGYFKNK